MNYPSDREIQASFKPQDSTALTEIGLLRRAMPLADAFKGRLPLAKELQDINLHFGMEIAQSVFTLALDNIPSYSLYARAIRSFDLRTVSSDDFRKAASKFEVTILATTTGIRGQKDEHVEQWRTWARSLGFTTDVIHTTPNGDLRVNAQEISRHLLSHPHPRRILITLGSGAAELRQLLTMRMGLRGVEGSGTGEAELSSLKLWINIAGAYNGSSYAQFINDSFWQKFIRQFAAFTGQRTIEARARRMKQLDPRLPAWRAAPGFPEGLQVVNIVGLAARSEISEGIIASHDRISRTTGPNDGVVGLYESIAHPGFILPVPGLTHRMSPLRIEPILKRVLASFVVDQMKAATATRSPEL